jgi:hypothetical protein
MQVTPVREYAAPRFPTHQILEQHPELMRIVPRRWSSSPVVLTALAGVCLLLDASRASGAASPKAPVSTVAPMFVHGGGMGGYGCVAVAAPLYLTEDEARSIIADEAKRAGIVFKSPGRTLPAVDIPVVKEYEQVVPRDDKGNLKAVPTTCPTQKSSLELDGTDGKHGISFEFVSREDFGAMAKGATPVSTYLSEDILGSAAALRKGLERAKPGGRVAVFYDPVAWGKEFAGPGEEISKATGDSMKQAREDLRAQVRDFVKWLKAQGVI